MRERKRKGEREREYIYHGVLPWQNMEANWKHGQQSLTRIECHSENSKGVYCLQYDDKKIVSGLRDNTIKVSTQAGTQSLALSLTTKTTKNIFFFLLA